MNTEAPVADVLPSSARGLSPLGCGEKGELLLHSSYGSYPIPDCRRARAQQVSTRQLARI